VENKYCKINGKIKFSERYQDSLSHDTSSTMQGDAHRVTSRTFAKTMCKNASPSSTSDQNDNLEEEDSNFEDQWSQREGWKPWGGG